MWKTAGRAVLERLGLYGLYSLKVKGPLLEDGWFRSFAEQSPVDQAGSPVPFITYPAMEFLGRRIRPREQMRCAKSVVRAVRRRPATKAVSPEILG